MAAVWVRVVAAAVLGSVAVGVQAQQSRPRDPDRPRSRDLGVDPSSPFPDLDGVNVDWPALEPATPDALSADGDGSDQLPVSLDYSVAIEGMPRSLAQIFRQLSALETEKGNTTALAQISRRARSDLTLMERLLRSAGHYAAVVDYSVTASASGERTVVTFVADPGPVYTFERVAMTADRAQVQPLVDELFTLKPADPVDAARIIAAEANVAAGLPRRGYPFAALGTRTVDVDHQAGQASYDSSVDAGPLARMMGVRLEGESPVSERHLRRLARFKDGDIYTSEDVEDLRRALVATGLFGTISVRPVPAGEIVDNEQPVNLLITAETAPLRTLAGQIGYATDEGFRVETSWQHRNFFPPQGALLLRGILAEEQQLASVEFRRSTWKRRDQTLSAFTSLSHEDREAFEATSFTLGSRVERETNIIWQKNWLWSVGLEFLLSKEDDFSEADSSLQSSQTYLIAAAPGRLGYDGSNDLLDPTRGFRLLLSASPEVSFEGGSFVYLKAQLDGSIYFPFMDDRLVLAGRGRLGSIYGAQRDDIAPSRRFYAGGGGSIRGYNYQEVGALDSDGDPLGGRSVFELSAEVRYRFGNFGVVGFVDGGATDTRSYPRFQDFQFGAGIGGRYYTNFGPIRIDLATPINPRPGDPTVAVYVSIGQAF